MIDENIRQPFGLILLKGEKAGYYDVTLPYVAGSRP